VVLSIYPNEKHCDCATNFQKIYIQTKDANRRNAFDQARIGTLGIKPKYITEVFVDKENAEMALHIVHTLPNQENF